MAVGGGRAGGVELFEAHPLHDISNKENMNKAMKIFMFAGVRRARWWLFTDIIERRADRCEAQTTP